MLQGTGSAHIRPFSSRWGALRLLAVERIGRLYPVRSGLRWRWMASLLVLVMATGLSGCGMFSSDDAFDPGCPTVGILGDGERLVRFEGRNNWDARGVLFDAQILNLTSECDHGKDYVDIEGEFALEVTLGPATSSNNRTFQVPFFIAHIDEKGTPLFRRDHVVEVEFELGETRKTVLEEFDYETNFPLGTDMRNQMVLLSLQLTRQELEYIRNQR